jgi:hypothetical protein
MGSLIKDYPGEGHPFKLAFYIIAKLPKLREKQRNLAGFRAFYARAYEDWGEEAHTKFALDFQKMREHQHRAEENTTKILEFLEMRGVEEVQKAAKTNDSGQLTEWESQLTLEGIEANEVKTILGPVIEDLKMINNTGSIEQHNNVTGRASPKIEVNPYITINWSPEFSQPQASGWSQNWMLQKPSEPTIPSSHSNYSGNRPPRAGTTDDAKSFWILCVDEANGGNYHALYSYFPSV